jgi:sulfate permease, SulP family
MEETMFTKTLNNFFGAFADGAILFPLLMTLSFQNGMNLTFLLLSSGLAYLVAGYIFKIPMSVQPLKSIAIAGLSVGASSLEIRAAAILLGIILLSTLFFDVEALAKKVPARLIHGVQIGLGCILIQQSLKYILPVGIEWLAPIVTAVGVMLFLTYKYQFPILGIFTSLVFFSSLIWAQKTQSPISLNPNNLRPLLILSLVLPQIVLTSANSILATVNVSQKYFGEKAKKVTVSRLVYIIGLGNIFSGILGGLPFCHGSGGVTAHYTGGARSNLSNYIIGSTLIIGAIAVIIFGNAKIIFSPLLLSIPLMAVGIMHAKLASASWFKGWAIKVQLTMMAATALISGNMLWVLAIGLIFEFINKFLPLLLLRRVT